MTATARQRLPLGPCNILTVEEAVAELGMRDEAGRAWLKAQGLITHRAGRPRVIAGDLVAALRGEPAEAPTVVPFVGRRVKLG